MFVQINLIYDNSLETTVTNKNITFYEWFKHFPLSEFSSSNDPINSIFLIYRPLFSNQTYLIYCLNSIGI